MVRRPDDVTWERYLRYVGACGFQGVLSLLIGAALFRFRTIAGEWLAIVCGAVPTWMAVPFKQHSAWGPEVWCVLALGVGLRLIRIDESMAYDEAYTFLNFARRPWYEAISDYNSTNNHLLNTFCMHWCYRWFGAGESSLRIPVLISGIATLVLTYSWAKAWRGRRAALLATALVAVSPMMITYSVDARGYMFVTAAALAMDGAAAEIDRDPQRNRGSWITLTVAAIIGLWSMPIMLYAVLATSIWFILVPLAWSRAVPTRIAPWAAVWNRLGGMFVVGAVTALAVAAFYAPAFIFRGLTFLHDPIMVKVSFRDAPRELAASLPEVWRWWTEGGIPPAAWAIALVIGLVLWGRSKSDWLRLLSPFAVVLVLNLIQRVAPPPRIYLFLFPWIALVASHGITRLFEVICDRMPSSANLGSGGPLVAAWCSAVAVCVTGGWYAHSHSVLFNATERASFRSMRAAMSHLHADIRDSGQRKHRLIAPLPCDLPARFYIERDFEIAQDDVERDRISVKVNDIPQPDESLWMLTRRDEAPEQVLASPLINLPGFSQSGHTWTLRELFETLELHHYEAPQVPSSPANDAR